MRKIWFPAILILSLWLLPFCGINSAWAQVFDGLISRVGLDGSVFDVYGRIGYQRMSVNLNVPVGPTNWGAEFEDIDAKMAKQDFVIGSLGINGRFGPRWRLFADASVSAENSGSVETSTSFSYFGGVLGPQGLSWSTRRVRWWEVNLGGSVNILNSGALLLGYKFDRLTQKLERPRDLSRWAAMDFFDYLGDLTIQTWSPYVGFRFEDKAWRFDLIWSPWLTSYRAEMPLQWISIPGARGWWDELQENGYSLRGRGGNLLEAYGEARFDVVEVLAAKLWVKASWLNCRGNGDRDMNSTYTASESQSATGSLTRYLWAVGIAGDLQFWSPQL